MTGIVFTSKKNGRSIFLPAAGYGLDSDLNMAGSYGRYWSGTFNEDLGRDLFFASGGVNTTRNIRYIGQSVRPVSE